MPGWGDVALSIGSMAFGWSVKYGKEKFEESVYQRSFKSVFGSGDIHLVYGELRLHPQIERVFIPESRSRFVKLHPFTKDPESPIAISASRVASECEVRATAHLASALGSAGRKFHVVSDELIRDRLDVNMVSFGMMSNLKSQQLFSNAANCFAEFDPSRNAFVRRSSDRELLHRVRGGFDYGVLIKVHPSDFPSRTWISCAGYGEIGTSGTAWFLANKWRDIASRTSVADDPFVGVVEVDTKVGDESASLSLFEPLSGAGGLLKIR